MRLHEFNRASRQTEEQCGSKLPGCLDVGSCLRRQFLKQTPSVKQLINYTELIENTEPHQVIQQKELQNSLKTDSKITLLLQQRRLQLFIKESLNPDQLKQLGCFGSSSTGLFTSIGRLSSSWLHSFSKILNNIYPLSVQANTLGSTQVESTCIIFDTS